MLGVEDSWFCLKSICRVFSPGFCLVRLLALDAVGIADVDVVYDSADV